MKIEIDERTREMSDAILRCRAKGHVWDIELDVIPEGQRRGVFHEYTIVEECARCTSIRKTTNSVRTRRMSRPRRYKYCEGYQATTDGYEGALERGEARMALDVRNHPELFQAA